LSCANEEMQRPEFSPDDIGIVGWVVLGSALVAIAGHPGNSNIRVTGYLNLEYALSYLDPCLYLHFRRAFAIQG